MLAAPGTGTDIPARDATFQTTDYSYTFDPELEKAWAWSEKYATQPEILRYLGFVADRYDLRRDIRFHARSRRRRWDQAEERWLLDDRRRLDYILPLLHHGHGVSVAHPSRRRSMVSRTSRVRSILPVAGHMRRSSLADKRVAVIGTGSSGIQAIPLIAEQAAHLTVFQRTPNFALPAHNGPAGSGSPGTCWKATAPATASRPAGRFQVCRGKDKRSSAGSLAMPSAAGASRRPGPAGDLVLHADPALG